MGGRPKPQFLHQKLHVKGVGVFLLESIYGQDDSGEEDSSCVICLTNERDTTVVPCRHLALCSECAAGLLKTSSKCPVCRGPIEKVMCMGREVTS
eukprot:NODE_4307_length_352_cov_309.471947_g3708_i0.p1 GENE.NODE_4307_length_352_cov_309.471947_g3708_i0~~NODE_4307_length_352_cov_309.471947_g3708_i0.p1  ORF type:complete len:103 (-),score=19.83 NODE_4307_length_352_cov_309.471947_g3708_i0:43-327(-)